MRLSYVGALIPIGLVLVPLGVVSAGAQGDSGTGPQIVATVNGVPVYRKDVEPAPHQLESAILNLMVANLRDRVVGVIEERAIREAGLHVTDEELRQGVDSSFSRAGIGEDQAQEISRMYVALFAALDRWLTDKKQDGQIYKEYLDGVITRSQWQQWKATCDSRETLAKLKSQIPSGLADMKRNSFPSTKMDLLREKLTAHITSGIEVTEEEVNSVYSERYASDEDHPDLGVVADEIRSTLLAEKRQDAVKAWWRLQFQRVQLDFMDERVKTLWMTMYGRAPAGTEPVPVQNQ